MLDIEFTNEYELKVPHSSNEEEVVKMKNIIGSSIVDAYSIDSETYKIIQGKGQIKNNEMWNYHNNYDMSSDEMYFNSKTQWFTLSEDRVKEVYNLNAILIRNMFNCKLEEYKETL